MVSPLDYTALTYIAPASPDRLASVMRKAARGEPIRIAAIGGSITQGAGASDAAHRWLNLTALWFLDRYGTDASARLINAGIGSTESPLGALRLHDDVLQYQPDLVFVDYSVNNFPDMLDSYESLLRKLLAARPTIAVVPIQFCNAIGQGQGDLALVAVCQKYGLGSISYQRGILAYLAAGGTAGTYSNDTVHPNDAGNAVAAHYAWHWFDTVKAELDARAVEIAPPSDNSFEKTAFIQGPLLSTTVGTGFTYDALAKLYRSTVAGSFAEWNITVGGVGTIWIAARVSSANANGVIATFVDDVAQSTSLTQNMAWSFDKLQLFRVAVNITPGEHRLRIITGSGVSGALVDIFGIGWTVDL